MHGAAGAAVTLDKATPGFAGSGWSNRPFRARSFQTAQCQTGKHGRFRPSPPSFGLFAARRRAAHRAARRARQGRSSAGAGAHRHQQHVRRARILGQDGGRRASSRSSAARCRSIAATRTTRCVPAAAACRPAPNRCRGWCCWPPPRPATATCCTSIRAPFSTMPAPNRPTSSSPGSTATPTG